MKSPEQLKGAIRNISSKKNLRPQEVLQMFLFERILERLALSKYSNNFIHDLHMLYRLHKDKVNMNYLRAAVLHTAEKRGSLEEIKDWRDILRDIREEPPMHLLWKSYAAENSYASELTFTDVLETTEQLAADLNL